MKKIVLFILICIQAVISNAQCASNGIDHWESCVLDNQIWKYKVPTANIANWKSISFNDSSWLSGKGGMGFGDNDDSTTIATSSRSAYMRKTFTIIDTSKIKKIIFCMDFDDGFVAYLNGVEIARINMNQNQNWNSLATATHEALLYQNLTPDYFTIPKEIWDTILVNGINVLSVETHNNVTNSPDLTSRPYLQLGITNAVYNYSPTPTWFQPPIIFASKLPLIIINTLGQTIKDDPRVICNMGVVDNGLGNLNCVNDTFNHYNGKISIEYRGSTSQTMFPKKPFGFSTVDSVGNSINVSLLGYPSENDWILLSPYTDKSFMRDALSFNIAREMNWYASQSKFVEVVVNDLYQGVYVLLEKIKVDKNRVNIFKMDSTMNSGDALTGGYIFKIDKVTGNSGNGWNSSQGVTIQNHVPSWDEVTTTQNNYLKNYINGFETALWSTNFADPNLGYRKMANPYSFADLFIINELTNNIDGYRWSTFIHKDRDSKCGRFTMGPIWDFNLSFGNGDYCNGNPTSGWQLYTGCGLDAGGFWVDKMLQDPWFKNLTNCRWNELRQTTLSNAVLFGRIDSFYNHLKEASVRDSTQWQTIGTYVWPNGWVANSWDGEIDSMKLWMTNRLIWMDANMYTTTQACGTSANMNLVIDEINYHSDSTIDAGDWIELYNYGTTPLNISNAVILDGNNYEKYCVIPNNSTIAAGARLVLFSDSTKFAQQFPLVTNKLGPLCFNLSDGGQKIVINDKDNKLITAVNYLDSWQISTDGNGRTLQLVSTLSNPNNSNSWFAGCVGGSPGAAYTLCVENSIYSEINYNSSATADAGDWLELYNKSNVALDLSNWKLKDGSNNQYIFPVGTTLASNKYLVMYSDAAKFANQFPTVVNKLGPLGFGLQNTGNVIKLYNQNNKLVYSVCYGVSAPWTTAPNGGGKTLENMLYVGNHNASSAWIAGCPKGSPGYLYDPSCSPVSSENVLENDKQIYVYPNPSFGQLNISTTLILNDISVYDLVGKKVFQSNKNLRTINLDFLSNGNYIIKCTSNNSISSFGFSKK